MYACQARCTCGWEGEITDYEEARREKSRHKNEYYVLTWDDVCWLQGIGPYGQ